MAAAAACLSVEPRDCAVRCSAAGACPEGTGCGAEGWCRVGTPAQGCFSADAGQGDGGTGGGGGGSGGGAGGGGASAQCNVVTQAPCALSQKCAYTGAPALRLCVSNGTLPENAACPPVGADQCVRGTICAVIPGADAGRCYRSCDTAADCTSGSGCDNSLTINGTTERPKFCGGEACNPLLQNCGSPIEACGVGSSYDAGTCRLAGPVVDGGSCVMSSDCTEGTECAGQPGNYFCKRLCARDGGMPSCPTGTCSAMNGPVPAYVGVCQ
jgi:hypothetical protein